VECRRPRRARRADRSRYSPGRGSGADDASGAWRPPPLEPDKKRAKDWLLLKSGEVLRGEIEYLREDKVQFDSDELEDLEIDWSDVIGFGSPRRNTYRFGNDVIVTGTAEMRAGAIRVDTGTEVREFPRSALYSMIEGELREIDYWSLRAGLGLTLRSGNSDQADLTARVEVKRETALTRTLASYETAYSQVESNDVTDNQRVIGYFAYFITTRTSLAAPIVELYRDRVRNVDLRTTVAAGVGYDLSIVRRWNGTSSAAPATSGPSSRRSRRLRRAPPKMARCCSGPASSSIRSPIWTGTPPTR
jgi:hypothetical protein